MGRSGLMWNTYGELRLTRLTRKGAQIYPLFSQKGLFLRVFLVSYGLYPLAFYDVFDEVSHADDEHYCQELVRIVRYKINEAFD